MKNLEDPSKPVSGLHGNLGEACWVVLHKKSGESSMRQTTRVKRYFSVGKAGHAGTLDPMAQGVLPIALQGATTLIPHVMKASKGYTFGVQWGHFTDTEDAWGVKDLEAPSRIPSRQEIEEILPDFLGEIFQIPPRYSACHHQGMRAYTLAREGKEFQLSSKKITIMSLALCQHQEAQSMFHVTCSSGTYVRSLARDMALALGLRAHVNGIHRTFVGPFTGGAGEETPEDLGGWKVPVEQGCPDLLGVQLSFSQRDAMWQGRELDLSQVNFFKKKSPQHPCCRPLPPCEHCSYRWSACENLHHMENWIFAYDPQENALGLLQPSENPGKWRPYRCWIPKNFSNSGK